MIFFVHFVFVLGVLSANNVRAQSENALPSDFPVCKRSDPDLNQCARSVMMEWWNMFIGGIESLNVHSTDPWILGRANFVYDNGIVKGVVSLRKLVIVGLSGLEIRNISIKLNGSLGEAEQTTFFPKLHITAKYRGEFTLLGIKLRPNGLVDIRLHNITLFSMHKVHTFDRDNGYSYLKIDSMQNRVVLDRMYMNFTGVSTDKITNDAVVQFVNTNWRQIFYAVAPDTINIWEPYVVDRLNQFLNQVPLLVD